jgi:hypothetical protein
MVHEVFCRADAIHEEVVEGSVIAKEIPNADEGLEVDVDAMDEMI